jgi:hypothetical protein
MLEKDAELIKEFNNLITVLTLKKQIGIIYTGGISKSKDIKISDFLDNKAITKLKEMDSSIPSQVFLEKHYTFYFSPETTNLYRSVCKSRKIKLRIIKNLGVSIIL